LSVSAGGFVYWTLIDVPQRLTNALFLFITPSPQYSGLQNSQVEPSVSDPRNAGSPTGTGGAGLRLCIQTPWGLELDPKGFGNAQRVYLA
jgi:hypothetical protein